MTLTRRRPYFLSFLFVAPILFGGTGHALKPSQPPAGLTLKNCESETFNITQAPDEKNYSVIEKNRQHLLDDAKTKNLESVLENRKIKYQLLTDSTLNDNYLLVDIKGASAFNQVSCEAFLKWKTLITLTASLPVDIGGAFDGFNESIIKGHLHLANLDEDVLYHELIHAFLSYSDYQNSPSPLSVYYIRDRELEKKDFAYANYLSGQEIAAFTFQALLYPKRRHTNLENLLNIANFAKNLSLQNVTRTEVLFKFHKGLKMAGLKLQTGEIYFPVTQKDKASETELRNTLTKKFENFILENKKIDAILKSAAKTTDFAYAGLSLKENLSQTQEKALLIKIREDIFGDALKPQGYFSEFMNWTQSVWTPLFEKKN